MGVGLGHPPEPTGVEGHVWYVCHGSHPVWCLFVFAVGPLGQEQRQSERRAFRLPLTWVSTSLSGVVPSGCAGRWVPRPRCLSQPQEAPHLEPTHGDKNGALTSSQSPLVGSV